MGLVEEVRKVLAAAGKLKGPAGNEANTKALLIEPMLAALGWGAIRPRSLMLDDVAGGLRRLRHFGR